MHVGERKGGPYIYLNNEELANINPKVMILATNGKTDKNRTKFIDPAVWKSLKAVKDNKVYDVDRNKWLQSRGIIASESMAEDLEKLQKKQNKNRAWDIKFLCKKLISINYLIEISFLNVFDNIQLVELLFSLY